MDTDKTVDGDSAPEQIEGGEDKLPEGYEMQIEALRDSRERFRAIFENAGIGMALGGFDGKFLMVNKTLCKMLGYEEQELIGKTLPVVDVVDLEEDFMLMGKLVKQELDFYQQEKRYRKKDGDIIWGRSTVSLIFGEGGDPAYALGMLEDITERKKAEEKLVQKEHELMQAQKMEAVGRLAGGVAHDFNNLLTAISGNTSILLSEMEKGDPRRADLLEVEKAAQRAAGLTKQLLAFSRNEKATLESVKMVSFVLEQHEMLDRLIGEDIQLEVDLPEEEVFAVIDSVQMGQIFLNLAVNARDAMPQGGTLRIALSKDDSTENRDRTSLQENKEQLKIEVSDTGVGIPEEYREKIFEPFFTTKKRGSGTGLGLSTLYGVVKNFDGEVQVASEVGKGTTFTILLPISVEEPKEDNSKGSRKQEENRAGAESGNSVKGTILLVEDDEAVRKLSRRFLTRGGYWVLEAENSAEALQICQEFPGHLDLLLSDVIMPETSGPRLAEKIHHVRPRLPVLYMSGYTQDVVTQRGELDNQQDFLEKPFEEERLLEAVEQKILTGGRLL